MDSPEAIDRQKAEWEAYSTKELLEGRCPYSGELMRARMDWWDRRVLMCPMCDCFGYPLVMSDGPGETCSVSDRPDHIEVKDLTDGELDW